MVDEIATQDLLAQGKTILIRADAGVFVGTGHVMRCLALAQAWQDQGGRAVFAMAESTPVIDVRLAAESCTIVPVLSRAGTIDDAIETSAIARNFSANWIVVDGYRFDGEYQRALKVAGCRVLCIDDFGRSENYSADIILDQNANSGEDLYPRRGQDAVLLLGTRYVLLRREFWTWRGWTRPLGAQGNKVLISMGGSDPDNLTENALDAVQRAGIDHPQITVVVGGSNPHASRLELLIGQRKGAVRLLSDPREMPEVIAAADIAMLAGGGTLWEALFMQCAVMSYSRDPLQRSVVRNLHDKGVAIDLCGGKQVDAEGVGRLVWQLASSQESRERMAEKGRDLIDGCGTRRVVAALLGREIPR